MEVTQQANGPSQAAAPQASLIDPYDLGLEAHEATEEPESTPTPPSAPPAAASAESLPRHLLSRARALGLDPQDLEGMSAAELRETLRDVTMERLVAGRLPGAVPAPAQTSPAAVQTPAPTAPAAAPTLDELDRFDLGVDEEGRPRTLRDFDPGLVRLLKHQQQQLQELRSQLTQQTQARQAETMDEWIDRQFERLGSAYEAVIGRGSRRDVAPTSGEYGRRLAILHEARRLAGAEAPPEEQIRLIPQAAKNLFGAWAAAAPTPPAPTPPAPAQAATPPARPAPANGQAAGDGHANGNGNLLASRQQLWDQAGLHMPTQRRGAGEPDGRAKAEKAVASYLRDNALESTSRDEFP